MLTFPQQMRIPNQIPKSKNFPVFLIAAANILLPEFPKTDKYDIPLKRRLL
jgi:hypothetical protein